MHKNPHARFIHQFHKCFTALVFTLLFVPSLGFAQQSEQEMIGHVEKAIGPILDLSSVPMFQQILMGIFNDLAQAHQRLGETQSVFVNKIHVVQSPVVNAFIVSSQERGTRVRLNVLFITTAMIKYLGKFEGLLSRKDLSSEAFENFKRNYQSWLGQIAGVVSHELGHPLEEIFVDRHGANVPRYWARSQASEIAADISGSLILREAGYPDRYVYDLVDQFTQDQFIRASAISAATGTHPPFDFRGTSLRLFLTAFRLERGDSARNIPVRVPINTKEDLDRFRRDYEVLSKPPLRWSFDRPKNFAELLKAFRELKDLDDYELKELGYHKLHFNRLVLTFDQLVASREALGTLPGALIADPSVTEILKILLEPKNSEAVFTGSDSLKLRPYFSSEGNSFLKTHWSYLKSLKFYGSDEYGDYVTNQIGNRDPKNQLVALVRASHFMATSRFTESFGDKLVEMTQLRLEEMAKDPFGRTQKGYDPNRRAIPRGISESGDSELHLTWMTRMMRELGEIPRDPQRWYFRRTISSSPEFPEGPLPLAQRLHWNVNQETVSLLDKAYRQVAISARGGNVYSKQILQEYQKEISKIWENRGYYAALDLFSSGGLIAWQTVAEVMEIPIELAKNQIESALKSYLSGRWPRDASKTEVPTYAQLLRSLAEKGEDPEFLREAYKREGASSESDMLFWARSSLYDYFIGEKNPEIVKDAELIKFAKRQVGPIYLMKTPSQRSRLFKSLFLETAKKNLKLWEGAEESPNTLLTILVLSYQNVVGSLGLNPFFGYSVFLRDMIEATLELKMAKSSRGVWLNGLLVNLDLKSGTFEPDYTWLKDWTQKEVEETVSNLIENEVVSSAIDLLQRLRQDGHFNFHKKKDYDSPYLVVLGKLAGLMKADVRRLNPKQINFSDLLEMTRLLHLEVPVESPVFAKQASIQDYADQLVELAEKMSLTTDQIVQFFEAVTLYTSSKKTDHYLLHSVIPVITEADRQTKFETWLKAKKVFSPNLAFSLTKEILEPEIERLQKKGRVTDGDLYEVIIKRLKEYVPTDFLERDTYIEALAWRLGVKGVALFGLIEDQKGTNWRKTNPLLVNLLSVLTVELGRMTVDKRKEFMSFLVDPAAHPFGLSNQFVDEVAKQVFNDLKIKREEGDLVAKSRDTARAAKAELERFLRDSKPIERIPLIEFLLTGGRDPFMKQPDWPQNITEPFLHIRPGSAEEALLQAYLVALSRLGLDLEIAPSLAYALSQSSSHEGSSATLFEIFGPVGKKIGQLSSTFEIFGPKVAKDTEHLKDNARPMSKHEILEELKTYNRSVYDLVDDPIEVLGSASIKTIVRTRLKDGSETVLAIRPHNAKDKIETNVLLGKVFLDEIKHLNLALRPKLLQALVYGMGEQLRLELDLTFDVTNTEVAHRLVANLSKTVKLPKGWSFGVPETDRRIPISDSCYGMIPIDGKKMRELSPDVRSEIGPALVEASFQMLFRYGWLEADRHTGNWLIDLTNKKIYWIDFGQLQAFEKKSWPWSWDDRLTLAGFLQALANKDIDQIIRMGFKMGEFQGDLNDLANLRADLAQVFSTSTPLPKERSEQEAILLGVVSALAENNLKFENRFLLGAIKGLMTIFAEKYASTDVMVDLMQTEIRRLLLQHAPAVILDRASGTKESLGIPSSRTSSCQSVLGREREGP